MVEVFAALIVPLAKLVDIILSDDNDAEQERQALMDMEKAFYAERLKRRLAEPR